MTVCVASSHSRASVVLTGACNNHSHTPHDAAVAASCSSAASSLATRNLHGAAATSCFFNLRLCAGPRAPEPDAQRAMGGVVVDVDVDGQQAVRHGSPKAGVLRGRRRTAALFSFAQSRQAPPARRNRLHLPAAAWVVCSSCSSPKPGERHVESVNDFFPTLRPSLCGCVAQSAYRRAGGQVYHHPSCGHESSLPHTTATPPSRHSQQARGGSTAGCCNTNGEGQRQRSGSFAASLGRYSWVHPHTLCTSGSSFTRDQQYRRSDPSIVLVLYQVLHPSYLFTAALLGETGSSSLRPTSTPAPHSMLCSSRPRATANADPHGLSLMSARHRGWREPEEH